MRSVREVTRTPLWRCALQEPLVHFFAVGLLAFVVFDLLSGEDIAEAPNRIVVDHDALAAFLQLRSKAIADDDTMISQLSPAELKELIDDYVRDEALYREAKALGLDVKDVGVRQRMVRQLEFINRGVVASSIELTDDDLREFLKNNEQRYLEPPSITFTHVFLNAERHGEVVARQRAESLLRELNGAGGGVPVAFHEAPAHGDRFLYHQNYVDREESEIKSHFGPDMGEKLFALTPDDKAWRGQYRSPYGYHLVLVTRRAPPYLPPFEELRRRLESDAYLARLDRDLRRIESKVIKGYSVEIDEALRNRIE